MVVIRARQRPAAAAAAAAAVAAPPPTQETEEEVWIREKAKHMHIERMFRLNREMELLTEEETMRYPDVSVREIQPIESSLRAQIELYGELPGFREALEKATRTKDYRFDPFVWARNDDINKYEENDVVLFRRRTTAFTLDRPCPHCGKKQLIAESAVFTRAADEAVDQFATCKNCSSRYRLQSVM